ncbi:MAG: TlpA family protein disulfide reductase [Pseudomonadota bacterium]
MGQAIEFELPDQQGETYAYSGAGLVVFIKEDCPTCRQVLPLLNALAATSPPLIAIGQTVAGNRTLVEGGALRARLLDDAELLVSYEHDVEVVPTLLRSDADGQVVGRLEGFEKDEWRAFLTDALGAEPVADWDALPQWAPGCGSLSVDPAHAPRLAAMASGSPLRARAVEIGSLDDEFEFLFDQGFTDGLPVLPPTPERVMRMLGGTGRDAQEVVATMPPNLAPATVEKIAINAVMAGCKPDYLPVVIAAIEAITTDEFNVHGVMSTTMGASPVLVVNGPIRQRLGMNMKLGALGQGNRANLTIGRAVRLCVRNIGGAQPGGTERSTMGNPMKITMCFPEWEERSDWTPLHVERGFEAHESVVTAFAMTSGPTLMVDQTSRSAAQLAGSLGLCLEALHHPRAHGAGDALLVVAPEHVDTLARDGYDKAQLRERIQEVTQRALEDLAVDEISGVGVTAEQLASMDEAARKRQIPKFASVDNIHVVVAGSDAGKFSAGYHGWLTGPMGSSSVSRRIEA